MKSKILLFLVVVLIFVFSSCDLLEQKGKTPKNEEPEQEKNSFTATLSEVFGGDGSDAEFDKPLNVLPKGVSDTVKEIYVEKNGKGYAVVSTTSQGYEGEIGLIIGVDNDKKITGVSVTHYGDTKGGKEMSEAVKGLVGKGSDEFEDMFLVSGATYSSIAVRTAIKDALWAVELLIKSETNDNLLREAFGVENLDAVFYKHLEILPEGTPSTVKEVYEAKNGQGFVVLLEIPRQYTPKKICVMVGVGTNGNVKGIVLTQYPEPPESTEEIMQNALMGLVGKGINEIDGVDLVSGATYTSNSIKDGVKDAIRTVQIFNDKSKESIK